MFFDAHLISRKFHLPVWNFLASINAILLQIFRQKSWSTQCRPISYSSNGSSLIGSALYIGVGRFRILGGPRFRILGGPRFRILGGPRGGGGAKFPAGT